MQKTIAVITGASSGMGAEFVRTIESFGVRLDEIWAIARRQERLEALQAPCPVRPLALDLTDPASFSEYQALLEQEQPRVALLINASGFGKFAATWQTPLEHICCIGYRHRIHILKIDRSNRAGQIGFFLNAVAHHHHFIQRFCIFQKNDFKCSLPFHQNILRFKTYISH